MVPTAGVGARGVSLVLVVTDLLVPPKLGQEAGLEIVGNPITAPPGSLGADIDKRRSFFPAKVGSGAPQAPWMSVQLAVFLGKAPDWSLGTSRE